MVEHGGGRTSVKPRPDAAAAEPARGGFARGIGGALFVVAVGMAFWVAAAAGIAIVVGTFGVVSARQVRCAVLALNDKPDALRAERVARVAARERVNLAVAALVVLLLVTELAIGSGRATRPAAIGAMFACGWVFQRRVVAEQKSRALLNRLLHEGSGVRKELKAILDALGGGHDCIISPDGALRASLLMYVAALSAWVGVAAVAWGPVQVEERATAMVTVGKRLLRIAPEQKEPPEPKASPPQVVTTPSTAAPEIPAREVGNCRPEDAQTALAKGVPPTLGKAMFDAWYEYGSENIGCPIASEPPYRSGRMWIAPLEGGADSEAFVIGRDDQAAVVLGDFSAIVRSAARDLIGVDGRVRWGAGSAQLVVYADDSCRLMLARDYGETSELPPSVTAVVLAEAKRLGAFPVVTNAPSRARQMQYEFDLLVPAEELFGSEVLTKFHIEYDADRAVATLRGGATASDRTTCPSDRHSLHATADAIEREARRQKALAEAPG